MFGAKGRNSEVNARVQLTDEFILFKPVRNLEEQINSLAVRGGGRVGQKVGGTNDKYK